MDGGMVSAFAAMVASIGGGMAGASGGSGWRVALAVLSGPVIVGLPLCYGWIKAYDFLLTVKVAGHRRRDEALRSLLLVGMVVGGMCLIALEFVLSLLLARRVVVSLG